MQKKIIVHKTFNKKLPITTVERLVCALVSTRPWRFFIGPESDHWLCLSLTPKLNHSLLFSKLD